MRKAGHFGLHPVCRLERIGIGLQEYTHQRCRVAVDATSEFVILGAQFHPRHVLETQQRAITVGAHHDIFKFLRFGQTAARGDAVHQLLRTAGRRLANLAGGKLRVLLVQHADQVGRSYL